MFNRFTGLLILFIVTSFVCSKQLWGDTKTYTTGCYVIPNQYLTSDVEKQLINKLKIIFSKSNIMISDGTFPLVTVISYQESEVITVEGVRRSYKSMGILSCSVVSLYDTASLGIIGLDIEGVGTSPDLARANSIKSLQISPAKLMPLVDKIVANSQISVDKYSRKVLDASKNLKLKQLYVEAIANTIQIPKECSFYPEVTLFNQECEQLQLAKLEKEEKERLRKEEEARELERQKLALEKYKFDREKDLEKHKFDTKAAIENKKLDQKSALDQAKLKSEDNNKAGERDLNKLREENRARIELARTQSRERYDSEYQALVRYIVSR